ncbi:serine/arginine-rich splicing factor 12-like [Hibiscus syriacus]|uniref:serine/arginine-rich splicing factor 12-like n=1 Tax=Hibiscus syriacus TaxID=106335 RepID=UPI0019209546|nr:serine/arginine-rich splicing factor 12-like [Hibiscus syriacus]
MAAHTTEKASGKLGEVQTLFVQNIPPRYHWSGLRQLFGRHGDVVSSYIGRKNDRTGKRFDFVRFSKKEDIERAIQRLNGFWQFGYRLSVKEARYKAKNPREDLNSPSNSNTTTRVPNDKNIIEEGSKTQTRRRSSSIQGVIDDEVVRKL